jgi:hypothetical protein
MCFCFKTLLNFEQIHVLLVGINEGHFNLKVKAGLFLAFSCSPNNFTFFVNKVTLLLDKAEALTDDSIELELLVTFHIFTVIYLLQNCKMVDDN